MGVRNITVGVQTERSRWGATWHYGTREELESSGLIPPGIAFPGDVPGKRGARWVNADGRPCSMRKWTYKPVVTFELTIGATEEESKRREQFEASQRLANENSQRLLDIDSSIARFDESREQQGTRDLRRR